MLKLIVSRGHIKEFETREQFLGILSENEAKKTKHPFNSGLGKESANQQDDLITIREQRIKIYCLSS
ncbi:MAG: hypothetical protein CMI66_00030 [Pedosphaera sp.]|nr:hypothetical protein [Pedosphaera sp.]HAW02853.1 hypothetical protein [Verrucomicrobiales bacterium]HBP57424.1 hypothetical protein [Verrucomicrobiales bacterium]HCP39725.1 hypothetical protein [Verrucomicrobiales bacterium]HCZ02325.1 hypothetical protein [Verrucomicrobiales bacterium]|tara:strand:- start:800 stop:1000 length:201 start_codon:yes stop_codon:yes gene_type:complete